MGETNERRNVKSTRESDRVYEIRSGIDALAKALTGHNHIWSTDERRGYERAMLACDELERRLMEGETGI
jgi:hypothetical protein